MSGQERREKILQALRAAAKPVSGSRLAREMEVSRQVIVQDMAILRAAGEEIIATARGYILQEKSSNVKRTVIAVRHGKEQLEDEMQIIVDCGGKILDVIVEHPVYGQINGNLMIENRMEIKEFIAVFNKNNLQPLAALTDGVHYHTIEAKNEGILKRIKEELGQKGYLLQEAGDRNE